MRRLFTSWRVSRKWNKAAKNRKIFDNSNFILKLLNFITSGGVSASSAKSASAASGPSDISDTDLPSASSQSETELDDEAGLAELEKAKAELQASSSSITSPFSTINQFSMSLSTYKGDNGGEGHGLGRLQCVPKFLTQCKMPLFSAKCRWILKPFGLLIAPAGGFYLVYEMT